MELTMFVCIDPCTWKGQDLDDQSTPMERINPSKLDFHQWIDAAELLGAKMILFVAKHVGGFCWWQTETSDYSIKNTPYKGGKGDLLKELSEACWQRGMKLGIYIYPGDRTWGAYLGGGGRTRDPSKQEGYNAVLRKQWEETLSSYGPVTEIWFDGSLVVPLEDIVARYTPNTIILQSPMANIRWVGNESGFAPYPAWNTVKKEDGRTGVSTAAHGDPDGELWMPLEVDIPLKNHYWFWSPENEKHLKTMDEMMEIYYKSVGRGTVLLINSAPDTTGLIPEADMELYRQFGNEIRSRFGKSIAETRGKGDVVELDLGELTRIDHVITMEDIAFGERVRSYVIEGHSGNQWFEIARGISVGHKRIDRFSPVEVNRIRFRCLESSATPVIRQLSAYMVGDEKEYNRLGSETDGFGNAWGMGESKKYRDLKNLGMLSAQVEGEGWYRVDLSGAIDLPGQYELLVSEDEESMPLRPESAEIWLEGVETPGFCKANKIYNRMEINITAVPTGEAGSIVVRFVLGDRGSGKEQLFLRKVVYD
jgi:alpha-L-fucosidase